MESIANWMKEQKVLCALIFVSFLCLFFGGLYLKEVMAEETFTCPKESVQEDLPDATTEKQEVTVDIKGAVKKPGVYRVQSTSIVNDVITLAGGLKVDADTSNINLGKHVSDEMIITIYTKEEMKEAGKLEGIVEEEPTHQSTQTESNSSKLISLNKATLEELTTLPGIGESKAKIIIQYRETCGPFKKKEELKNIKGIGEKVYEKLANYITV